MANLVFLEAATQSEGAETIIESNESLINFATAEVDALVEEQALHTAWHVGAFVENDFSTTYENVTDPIADIVTEATSIFSDIIATEDLTEAEKMDAISSTAHVISMGDIESLEEIRNALKHSAKVIGITGAVGAVGGAVGSSIKSMFSKEHKAWKLLVKQEKEARKKGKNASILKKIHDAKMKARSIYIKMRNKNLKRDTINTAASTVAIGTTADLVMGIK